MRGFVALIGGTSAIAALGLLLALAITARPSGDIAAMVVFLVIASILVLSTAYQIYRLLQNAIKPQFPRQNLAPIAALLIFGGLVGLTLVALAIEDGAHGMGLLLPGFLIHLVAACVARYRYAGNLAPFPEKGS
jgi:hypothetical protein